MASRPDGHPVVTEPDAGPTCKNLPVTTDRHPGTRRDGPFVATCAATLAVVGLQAAFPAWQFRILAPSLDLALDSVALVIACTLAVLSWVQYRDRGDLLSLHQASAFLVLAMAGIQLVAVSLGPDVTAPLLDGEPGHGEQAALTFVRGIAAVVFAIGGVASLRGSTGWPAVWVIAVPLVPAAAVLALAAGVGDRLPHLIVAGPDGAPVSNLLGIMVEAATVAVFFAGAAACRRVWWRDRRVGDHFLSLGLVLMAGAQLSDIVVPNTHPGPVASGDLLRMAFGIVMLLAIEAQARAMLAAQRRSNLELARLREVEGERAALEERARLSRDLHDGLTQDIWLAKMKAASLRSAPLDPATRQMVDELAEALEQGLQEARQVVLSLRQPVSDDGGFEGLLCEVVKATSDQFGIRVECVMPPATPPLPARTQVELIRIVQEALANARRHAQASRVTVRAEVEDDRFILQIIDNGRGFALDDVRPSAVGLRSMRERAAIIGGSVDIRSLPGEGTRVSVSMPFVPAATHP